MDARAEDRSSAEGPTAQAQGAEAVLAALPVPLVVVGPSGRVELCNAAAAALLGVMPAHVVGQHVDAVLAPVELIARVAAAKGRDAARCEVPCDRPDGITVRLLLRCAPFLDGSSRTSIAVTLEPVSQKTTPAPEDENDRSALELLHLAVRTRRPAGLIVDKRRCVVVPEGSPSTPAPFDALDDCFG